MLCDVMYAKFVKFTIWLKMEVTFLEINLDSIICFSQSQQFRKIKIIKKTLGVR